MRHKHPLFFVNLTFPYINPINLQNMLTSIVLAVNEFAAKKGGMRTVKSDAIWRTLAALSICATAVLLFGFGFAVKDMLYPDLLEKSEVQKVEPAETTGQSAAISLEEAAEIRVVALGDSLTKGTGDATGEGYVKEMVSGLRAEMGKPVRLLNNLAINGLQADDLAERLSSDNGFKLVLQQANLILFTIGGNDLFHSVRASNAGRQLSAYSMKGLADELHKELKSFEHVIEELHSINPNAKLVYVGLYNPFYDIKELRSGSLEVQEWNKEAYTLIHSYPNMMMVPTFDLFEGKIGDYLSDDHFHPNHQGYEQIAARIIESLN